MIVLNECITVFSSVCCLERFNQCKWWCNLLILFLVISKELLHQRVCGKICSAPSRRSRHITAARCNEKRSSSKQSLKTSLTGQTGQLKLTKQFVETSALRFLINYFESSMTVIYYDYSSLSTLHACYLKDNPKQNLHRSRLNSPNMSSDSELSLRE